LRVEDEFAVKASITSLSMFTLHGDLEELETTAEFYKGEVEHRDRQITTLREQVDRNKTSAWLERERAEALDRQLRFVRQLQSRFASDGHRFASESSLG